MGEILDHFEQVTFSIGVALEADCERLFQILVDSRNAGGCVALAGNGGSAATAEHLCADWGRQGRLLALGLCGCAPLMTALANDEGFENVFSDQVERLLRPRDVLVLFTTSGRSPNLVAAAVAARRRGVTVVALTGLRGSPVGELADLEIFAASDVPEVVEDVHLSVGHAIARQLKRRFRSSEGVDLSPSRVARTRVAATATPVAGSRS